MTSTLVDGRAARGVGFSRRMVEQIRRPLLALVALASLTSILWLESFGPHTDDGCRTEVHCLACRTALVRSAAADAPIVSTTVLVALDRVVLPIAARVLDVVPSGRCARGPPPTA